jgi:predicted RNase H-like HicB family nuclease
MKSTRRKRSQKPRRTYRLQVVVEIDEDGKYVASCPALEACYTQGDTFEEALERIRDVISLCLQDRSNGQRELDVRYPEVVGLRQIEVTI